MNRISEHLPHLGFSIISLDFATKKESVSITFPLAGVCPNEKKDS
jgi:hypothetical protein